MIYLAAAAATAFNLVCTGTIATDSFLTGNKIEPYTYVYRIDLAKNKWCEGECKGLMDIAEVQPTRLVLSPDTKVDTPSERSASSSWIDRETGEERALHTSGRGTSILMMQWKGQCTKAPFTGFPTFATKF